ncbi:hypothetical protein BCR32DRAFT_267614 [Anaeromyces robustus]|uniref:G-protein coupled receptors family 3 profile domain-containing protein n=1 Tax=Anaeromyces robustus TaxID=1754192 RepID=A0A1Y1X9M7_9FUNG|nr:hypothetical protein BCR32DRAFT_267614 [Anaeromyces robustus]|eukprot:ORX82460.1 hypothetical protein BCR32DRAFT_267614 [Anaeromyces robustus]
MTFLSKFLHLGVINFLITLFINVSYGQDTTIQILLDKPDVIKMSYWKNYSTLSDENLLKLKTGNSTNHVYFTYNINESYEKKELKDYKNYVDYIINELKTSTVDMFILDENFLFSDVAPIESSYVEDTFQLRQFHQYYLDMTDYIKKEELSFHDPKILEKGYLDGHLYGLPYEVDYDLFYYTDSNNNNNNNNNNNLQNSILEQKNWKDLLSMKNGGKNPLGLGLGNDEELLKLFTEYMSNNYDILDNPEEKFEMFYNDKSSDLFNDFRNFVKQSTTMNIKDFMSLGQEDAYNSFINGEIDLFKGKASHYDPIVQNNQNKPIKLSLPPKSLTVKSRKFLVINGNSKINRQQLIDTALKLTSKEMQLFRAENFGTIPTFDITQKGKEQIISNYCNEKSDLCGFLERMKSIDLKEFFNGHYNSPFMEVRLLLPQNLKQFLMKTNEPKRIATIFDNIKNLIIEQWNHRNVSKLSIYLPMVIFTLFSVAVMAMVYKNRNHPYLKPFSPNLCLLIILGFILRIISPQFLIRNDSIRNCQIYRIYDTIQTDLAVFPMFAITYRIFTIYTGKTRFNFSKVLNNKNLFKCIIIAIGFMICLSIFISLVFKSYIVSAGNIETYRHPICKFVGGFDYSIFERWINRFVFFGMVIMIIKTYRISKHYGQFSFVFILILNFLIEHTEDLLLSIIPSNGFFIYYSLVFIVSMIMYVVCIYLLVGNKLIYIMRHPAYEESNNSENYTIDYLSTTDMSRFLPMQKDNNSKNKTSVVVSKYETEP